MTLEQQVFEALSNAVENGYPHDFDRPARFIVEEIHDWSGIEGFDPENDEHMNKAIMAVVEWRKAEGNKE